MTAKKLRPFLPSIKFDVSKAFYQDLGFQITYEDNQLVIFSLGEVSFFVQDAYVKEWAENTMVQLFVDDLNEIYERVKQLAEQYENILIKPIFQAHYGKTFHLIGPEGVLWHMMESS